MVISRGPDFIKCLMIIGRLTIFFSFFTVIQNKESAYEVAPLDTRLFWEITSLVVMSKVRREPKLGSSYIDSSTQEDSRWNTQANLATK